jgi:hypothetical protein
MFERFLTGKALFLLYIAAVYLQFLVVDLLFTSFSSRNHWFLFCPTMSLRWSFAAQFIVCLFELSRLLMARDMLRFRLFCSCAIHAIAVEFLSFVAIVSAFLDVDGSPTAAYDNLAPAVLCVVFMLIVLSYS